MTSGAVSAREAIVAAYAGPADRVASPPLAGADFLRHMVSLGTVLQELPSAICTWCDVQALMFSYA
jgi:hypothetical protein